MESRVKRNAKKRSKLSHWFWGIFLFFILFISGIIIYAYSQVNSAMDEMHAPLTRDNDLDRQKELKSVLDEKDSINILLLGVDERTGDRGRSDTMILLSLNPKTDSMLMLSIPRDTYVNIPTRGLDKINHAYAFGGVDLAVETVESTFNLPVHLYARINMEGFQEGIDAIGGVTVNNTKDFSQGGTHFAKGPIHLDGKMALDYIRMRYEDPRGDIGRNERQREVITAALHKAASVSNMTKFGEILDILGSNVQTNIDMNRAQALFTRYLGTRNNIQSMEMSGTGSTIGGIWYYVVPDAEFNRITTEIKIHMEKQ